MMFEPAVTVADPVFETERSADWLAVTVVVEELLAGLESALPELMAAVFEVVVPLATAGSSFTTRLNTDDAPGARVAAVQVIVPVAPMPGVAQTNAGPLVCDSETKVTFAGSGSLRDNVVAVDGPPLVTVMV